MYLLYRLSSQIKKKLRNWISISWIQSDNFERLRSLPDFYLPTRRRFSPVARRLRYSIYYSSLSIEASVWITICFPCHHWRSGWALVGEDDIEDAARASSHANVAETHFLVGLWGSWERSAGIRVSESRSFDLAGAEPTGGLLFRGHNIMLPAYSCCCIII